MSDRVQTVKVGGVKSSVANVLSGIPQGSILGPILYLIYTNELPGISNMWCTHEAEINDARNLFGELLHMITRVITMW